MDTKVLRQKVLDLAIRGKLVPQDPNDEPASVLLERIRQQKQQMVKDGKLKAKDIKNDTIIFVSEDNLHYEKFADGSVKCIEDEIPFDLPDGWAWAKINTIAFVTKLAGFEYTKNIAPGLCEDGIPLFKGKNVQNSTIVYEFESFIPESVSDELQRSQVTKKCILTPYVGTIGNIGIHNRPGKYHLGSNVGKIELYNDNAVLLEEYVVAYLQSGFGYQQLTKHMKATAQASISIEAIRDVYLPIPPANEQLRMWSALSNALAMIERIENTELDITNLIKSTKSKILDLAIRGKLVPQDPNDEPASVLLERIRAEKEELIKQGKIKRDKKESVIFRGEDNSYYEKMADGKLHCLDNQLPFELPDGWEWCNLSMIGTTNIGLTYRPTDIEPGGIMVLRSCNIVNDQVDLSGLVRVKTTVRENQFAQKNDILICARNGSRSLVGKCALIPDLREPASFGAFMAIYRTEYFEFIVHYLRSSFFRSVFDDSNSTAINQLTQDTGIFFDIFKIQYPRRISDISGINISTVTVVAQLSKAAHTPTAGEFFEIPVLQRLHQFSSFEIIRVILTTEDDGFLLVSLDFALLDEFFFLCSDSF